MGEIARNLAESILLPMDVGVYAEYVKGYYESLRQGNIGQRLTQEGISLGNFLTSRNSFQLLCEPHSLLFKNRKGKTKNSVKFLGKKE